jgi:hypothetical protein
MYEVLQSLRDLPGTLGSFVIDEAGTLCARDLPSWFDDVALMEAGVRLASMRAAVASLAPELPFEGYTARFGEHLVVIRPVGTGSLCVLCPDDVDRRALQMSASLVARRIYASARRASELPPPPGAPMRSSSVPPPPPQRSSSVPPAAPVPHQPQAEPPQGGALRRFFRGRPVG